MFLFKTMTTSFRVVVRFESMRPNTLLYGICEKRDSDVLFYVESFNVHGINRHKRKKVEKLLACVSFQEFRRFIKHYSSVTHQVYSRGDKVK